MYARLENAWVNRRRKVTEVSNTPPVAVVTGGSEGIGLEIARLLAAEGRRLLLVARGVERLEAAAAELRAAHGVYVDIAPIDLAHIDAAHQLMEAVRQSGGHLDMLVNNAGVGLAGPYADAPNDDLLRLIDINCRVLADLTHRALPGMIARGQGGVLNIASLAGLMPGPYAAAYYASKAFVVALTEGIAQETAGTGVRVAVSLPGPVATGFHAKMGSADALYMRSPPTMTAERVARISLAGYRCRRTVIVPGVSASLGAVAVRLMPHSLLVPAMGVMLKPRRPSQPSARQRV